MKHILYFDSLPSAIMESVTKWWIRSLSVLILVCIMLVLPSFVVKMHRANIKPLSFLS